MKISKFFFVTALPLTLGACIFGGSSLSGTYTSSTIGAIESLTFDGSEVTMKAMGQISTGTVEYKDGRAIVTTSGGKLEFAVDDNCIVATGPVSLRLCKN
ncbi:hypothetical protein [Paracoccus aestuariivivens]|uniref:Lipoprotein n=1 Tax=Paracoccus aestuariivivens TaxID=1820333 RepID=A0A6L6J6V0_9RHOB|nr:hypothetical protein [Paracoccus aestuariivivens]MTH77316.1 hypothetical protein [Paracoccus aestuariivivens]